MQKSIKDLEKKFKASNQEARLAELSSVLQDLADKVERDQKQQEKTEIEKSDQKPKAQKKQKSDAQDYNGSVYLPQIENQGKEKELKESQIQDEARFDNLQKKVERDMQAKLTDFDAKIDAIERKFKTLKLQVI